MLPEVNAGRLICKHLYPAPPLSDIDPNFGANYDKSNHGTFLLEILAVSHLTSARQLELTKLIN